MKYLSKLYRRIKLCVASASGITALAALIAGIIIGKLAGTVLIIGGTLWIVSSGFTIFDSVSVHSIIAEDVEKLEKNVNDFTIENLELQGNIQDLEKVKTEYIQQNKKLSESLKENEQQVLKLSNLKIDYEKTLNEYKELVSKEEKEIDELKNSLESLESIKYNIQRENDIMLNMLKSGEDQVSMLAIAKEAYEEENLKLQESNKDNKKQIETLKLQLDKLKSLYTDTCSLMKQLKETGDLFTGFNDSISENVVKIENTGDDLEGVAKEMRELVDKLKTKQFNDIDENNDGIITNEEFEVFIGSQND